MIVYIFEYNPMYHESGNICISLHKTKSGAYKALKAHKIAEFRNWFDMGARYRKRFKFGEWECWLITKMKILE